jgi:hypothetical protein
MSNELHIIKCYIKSKLQHIDISINISIEKAQSKTTLSPYCLCRNPE